MHNADKFHEEEMTDVEYAFIEQKVRKDERLFTRISKLVAILFVVAPIVFGIGMELLKQKMYPEEVDNNEGGLSFYIVYSIALVVLSFLFLVAVWVAYGKAIKPLKLDVASGLKLVERSTITRKQQVKSSGVGYFYLTSTFKLSIEVTALDFEQFQVGDEINLEFSRHAKVYFGYY